MAKECDHDCSSCSESCSERDPKSMHEKLNNLSKVKKVFAVMSGKGGVGKSAVTSMLAVLANRMGFKTAIMDADITGPSIPRAFGIKTKADASDLGIFPIKSGFGISVMSINLLLENETDPVIWRGPILAGAIKQFWTDVIWDEVDVMFIDMPPGTGDVPLTVFQSLPIDGIIVVTSPQELVSMIVSKAVKMANELKVPVLGLVENMSYVKCPKCGEIIKIYGESKTEEVAKSFGLEVLAKIPVDPKISAASDAGTIEFFDGSFLDDLAQKLEKIIDAK
ncbi:MAG: Mrp/NBP35 family ATP-binding protein [Clostridia bacterium]|nr:Mrp/NBP35 family ATP-binding protein [Clostridia bacterium]